MPGSEFSRNLNAFPLEELAKYEGKYVAWNLEGTQILASGDNDRQVFEALKAAGLDPSQAVFSYVELPNEVYWGAAFLLGEELVESGLEKR
jgi:hypothetical protein